MIHTGLGLCPLGEAVAFHPTWLFAQMCLLTGQTKATVLLVYRSLLVRDTDPIYAPVLRELLGRRHRLEVRQEYADKNLMFGRGVWTVHQVLTKPHYQPEDFVDIDPDVGTILRDRGVEIVREIRGKDLVPA